MQHARTRPILDKNLNDSFLKFLISFFGTGLFDAKYDSLDKKKGYFFKCSTYVRFDFYNITPQHFIDHILVNVKAPVSVVFKIKKQDVF